MKKPYLSLMIAAFAVLAVAVFMSLEADKLKATELQGAWESGPATNRSVMIVTDRVFSVAAYDVPGRKLIRSYGGTWELNGDQLKQLIEWDSLDSSQVGKTSTIRASLSGSGLSLAGNKQVWSRVMEKETDLTGAWIITGNFVNDKANKRAKPFFPRRTMKVLSGSRFHWIAYNVETKQFINAGGGSYHADTGKYTETIEFFTKTPESVGKTLDFQYSFVDGDWRHKGVKSTGGPLDECWTPREALEKK
jgi:hypothetical protein